MTTTRLSNTFLFGSLLFGAMGLTAACNSFSPDLGASPFRCGTDNPRCPEGYSCVSYSSTEEICERDGNVLDRPDGAPPGEPDARDFTCANDGELEPNDTIEDPTLTGIPEQQTNLPLVGLAICPDTDQDYFEFAIENAGTDATVEISYLAERGQLQAELLNGAGSSIAVAQPVGNNVDLLRIAIPNLPAGTYYALVKSTGPGVENNYSITISTQE